MSNDDFVSVDTREAAKYIWQEDSEGDEAYIERRESALSALGEIPPAVLAQKSSMSCLTRQWAGDAKPRTTKPECLDGRHLTLGFVERVVTVVDAPRRGCHLKESFEKDLGHDVGDVFLSFYLLFCREKAATCLWS